MPETIFALASGAPPAAIAVVRISGSGAFGAAAALGGLGLIPRRALLRRLRDPATGEQLDRALVLAFPGPRSATGEDVVELHLHGGRAVIGAVLAALGALPGLRGAEPGEFTRRALVNGRIDLAEAEGLGDLLAAQTERQRRAALFGAEGALSKMVRDWAGELLGIAAQVEAALDFADEEDVAHGGAVDLPSAAAALAAKMKVVLDQPPVERLRDGVRVVLAGPPNAGKSTLLNCLAGREAAIVSPIPGTTRDVIEAPVVRDGIAYVLSDTAGLVAASDDPIEVIGVARARDLMTRADIVLWLGDDRPSASDWLWLYPRADRRDPCMDAARLSVSAASGEGITALWQAIAARSAMLLPREDAPTLNARQRELCAVARDALSAVTAQTDLVLVAEHLRAARRALDAITGAVGVEAMLDALFARFCIGK